METTAGITIMYWYGIYHTVDKIFIQTQTSMLLSSSEHLHKLYYTVSLKLVLQITNTEKKAIVSRIISKITLKNCFALIIDKCQCDKTEDFIRG